MSLLFHHLKAASPEARFSCLTSIFSSWKQEQKCIHLQGFPEATKEWEFPDLAASPQTEPSHTQDQKMSRDQGFLWLSQEEWSQAWVRRLGFSVWIVFSPGWVFNFLSLCLPICQGGLSSRWPEGSLPVPFTSDSGSCTQAFQAFNTIYHPGIWKRKSRFPIKTASHGKETKVSLEIRKQPVDNS